MTYISQQHYDIAILGGGVLGVSLAYHLKDSGLRVAVIERESAVATHASGLNAGMLRQLYRHPQLTQWASVTISSIPKAIKDDCFRETGSIILGRKVPDHHPHLFEACKIESPGGSSDAIHTKTDGLLDSPTFVERLAKEARKAGVAFHFGEEAISIEQSSSAWNVSTKNGLRIEADILVNASGAWINNPVSDFPELLVATQPYARHLFLVTGWPDGFMPIPDCGFYWDELNNWYLRLWDQHSRLVSICDETAAQPESYVPTSSVATDISEKLLLTLPQEIATNLKIGRSWHCFRTYTDDFLPIWGWDNQRINLFWLAAFGGFGMSTGFAAAADAAAVIAGKRSLIIPDFSAERVKLNSVRNHAVS